MSFVGGKPHSATFFDTTVPFTQDAAFFIPPKSIIHASPGDKMCSVSGDFILSGPGQKITWFSQMNWKAPDFKALLDSITFNGPSIDTSRVDMAPIAQALAAVPPNKATEWQTVSLDGEYAVWKNDDASAGVRTLFPLEGANDFTAYMEVKSLLALVSCGPGIIRSSEHHMMFFGEKIRYMTTFSVKEFSIIKPGR